MLKQLNTEDDNGSTKEIDLITDLLGRWIYDGEGTGENALHTCNIYTNSKRYCYDKIRYHKTKQNKRYFKYAIVLKKSIRQRR